jgi:uncharacterized membrane protein (UPF0136 family)
VAFHAQHFPNETNSTIRENNNMNNKQLCSIAVVGLVTGAVLGLVGALVTSASVRGLLWGIDGTALVVATALLALYHSRQGNDLVAGGFLVFAIGEGIMLSGAAMNPLTGSIPSFGAGASLWAAALALVSIPRMLPIILRVLGLITSLLFLITALQIFAGRALTPLTTPLPFFAYPFFVITLLGWAWVHWKNEVSIKPQSSI